LRVGIFGGSFNPVHRGHMRLAHAALSELDLNKLIFVPAGRPAFREKGALLPAALRVKLLKRAIRGERRFEVSACEMNRPGASYTVDTIKHFKKKFGAEATLYFLCGADTLRHFSRWKSPAEVLKLCRLVAATRPGHRPGRLPKGAFFMPFEALRVSSTGIRRRLRRGESVARLVPPGTEKILKAAFRERSV
jgi:nicotinate-nucleotide adenylyltransferase